jgi:hypothetical protein
MKEGADYIAPLTNQAFGCRRIADSYRIVPIGNEPCYNADLIFKEGD